MAMAKYQPLKKEELERPGRAWGRCPLLLWPRLVAARGLGLLRPPWISFLLERGERPRSPHIASANQPDP